MADMPAKSTLSFNTDTPAAPPVRGRYRQRLMIASALLAATTALSGCG